MHRWLVSTTFHPTVVVAALSVEDTIEPSVCLEMMEATMFLLPSGQLAIWPIISTMRGETTTMLGYSLSHLARLVNHVDGSRCHFTSWGSFVILQLLHTLRTSINSPCLALSQNFLSTSDDGLSPYTAKGECVT